MGIEEERGNRPVPCPKDRCLGGYREGGGGRQWEVVGRRKRVEGVGREK
jgi:hypothetical protein